MIRSTRLPILSALLLLGLAACDQEGAYGDANSIITVTSPQLWAEIEADVEEALQPTIRTVRDEKTFTVTYQDPGEPAFQNLKRFQQMLLIGTEDDPIVAEALERVQGRSGFSPPEVVQAYNVWARGQTVTVLLVPSAEEAAEAVRNRLGELNAMYDRQFREFARNRMFISGADTALADTLYAQAGFHLTVPNVYDWSVADSTYVFRNDNPDPAELIRQIAVTWRSPIPDGIQGDSLLAWRRDVAATHYSEPQLEVLDDVQAGPFQFRGAPAYQIQAVWQNTPEANWPAGGPFILRGIICPEQDRMYLVDAWLYAPGKEKYEYMIQLETILESFSCAAP